MHECTKLWAIRAREPVSGIGNILGNCERERAREGKTETEGRSAI